LFDYVVTLFLASSCGTFVYRWLRFPFGCGCWFVPRYAPLHATVATPFVVRSLTVVPHHYTLYAFCLVAAFVVHVTLRLFSPLVMIVSGSFSVVVGSVWFTWFFQLGWFYYVTFTGLLRFTYVTFLLIQLRCSLLTVSGLVDC